MKESLFDIFKRHPNWGDPKNDGRFLDEMSQAAATYVDSLLPLADRWQKAVEFDINQISTIEPPHTHFNKERQQSYSLGVFDFLLKVAVALKSHGFDISELDLVTQWRLGHKRVGTQIEDGLPKDKADQLYKDLKQKGFYVIWFRELCSNLYTVIGYSGKTLQTIPTVGKQNKRNSNTETPPPQKLQTTSRTFDDKIIFEELKKEWGKGKPKLIIMRLENKGIITANGDVYNWKIDKEHGYSKSLYVYFVFKASEKLGWREGKNKDRIPWKKFNPIFPNVSDNQNSRNSDLSEIKNEKSIPSLAYVIDDILSW